MCAYMTFVCPCETVGDCVRLYTRMRDCVRVCATICASMRLYGPTWDYW